MNDWTASQIKEIVKIEIEAERRLRDLLRKEDHRRLEEHKSAVKESLRIAEIDNARDRAELERRLGILNGAHEEAKRVLGTYVPRETWDKWLETDRDWKRRTVYFWIVTTSGIVSAVLALVAYWRVK